jgi:hypothetical protein
LIQRDFHFNQLIAVAILVKYFDSYLWKNLQLNQKKIMEGNDIGKSAVVPADFQL